MTTIVYVGNSGSGDISVLELTSSGGVRPVARVPVPGVDTPARSLPLALSPNAPLLFAASRSAPFPVTTFAIGADGGLSPVGRGRLPASMAYIATDRRGRYLLAAAYDAALVSSSAIEASGAVGATLDVVATVAGAHAIEADHANARVLFTSLGGDVLCQRGLDAETGRFREIEPGLVQLPRGTGPRHLALSPDDRRAFVLGELDGSIHAYPYDPDAGLARSPADVASALPDGFTGKPWAADIHLTPDGRFLYASERTSSTVVAFRLDPSSGKLARVGTYLTAAQPRAFGIAPSGRHLLAVGERSNTLRVHAIDGRTGALSSIGDDEVGEGPSWVEILELGPGA